MARQPRDYKAEYARRIELERRRSEATGAPFNRSRARGHRGRSYERTERRLRRLAKQTDTEWAAVRQGLLGIEDARREANRWYKFENGQLVKAELDTPRDRRHAAMLDIIAILERKLENTAEFVALVESGMTWQEASEVSQGHADYWSEERSIYLPRELWFYHPS